jgi:CheY-like chemotaxis protein
MTYKLLIVDDDLAVTSLVGAIFSDEGWSVSALHQLHVDALLAAVGRLEPDCVLLDGQHPDNYGQSWQEAARLRTRGRPIPTMMFTVNVAAVREAQANQTRRSQQAGFAASLSKPFHIDQLVDAATDAASQAMPFDTSPQAETVRTAALITRLHAAGATDIQTSARREWLTFRTASGTFVQLYWWQREGVYYVMRHTRPGSAQEQIGRCYDLEAAILLALLA